MQIPKIPLTKMPLPTRGVQGSPQIWLKQMSRRDSELWGMEQPLWVIDNRAYDLTQFLEKHPGGSSWLVMTKGQDITTLFVTHHIQEDKARKILEKYYKKECKIKNEPRFEFGQNYKEIRRRILNRFTTSELHQTSKTKIYCYILIIAWFFLLGVCSYLQSYFLAILCGFSMMTFYGIGHLFIHRKTPNLLSNVYLLIGFSAQEQQIMHAISHHPYSNTMIDYEYSGVEPIMNFARCLPSGKWYSFIALQILFMLVAPINALTKLIVVPVLTKGKQRISWQHLIIAIEVIYIYLFTGDWATAFKLWIVIIVCYGFTFGKMVLCPHRQIQLWSEGAPEIRDYVLHMVATTTDTSHQPMSAFKSLIFYSGFNIHVIHHLFPTIDHSKLYACNQIFKNYCAQNGIKIMVSPSMLECNKNMWKLQAGRNQFDIKIFLKQ